MAQAFPVFAQVEAKREAAAAIKQEKRTPFLSLIAGSQVPYSLQLLTALQRQYFFQSMLDYLHGQKVENLARDAAMAKRASPAAASQLAMASMMLPPDARKEREKAKMGEAEKYPSLLSQYVIRKSRKEEAGAGGSGTGAQASASLERAFKSESAATSKGGGPGAAFPGAAAILLPAAALDAQRQLVFILDDYARGDEGKVKRVVSEFESRVKAENYKPDDLMATLLLVIEDDEFSQQEGKDGGEGKAGGASHGKMGALVPHELRTTARDSAEVRLASVREMLRYYFERNPKDYSAALVAALGISSDREDDSAFLQERLAFTLASIGSFALAQRLLAEVKRKKEMDTKKCLLELGYRYDVKKKRLILGKRTCGSPVEAKGIIALLIGRLKK